MQASRTDSCAKPSSSRRLPAVLGLPALLFLVGATALAACSDDGKVLGSDGAAGSSSAGSAAQMAGSGGTAGQMSHGGSANSAGHAGSASTAGSGQAGAMALAGNGGAISAGGQAGTGGATCQATECLRANVCLDHCGGNVVYTGCCNCGASEVEQLTCGTAGSGGGGGGGDCVGTTCVADQTCVAYRVVGGAVLPPDTSGSCPTGKHLEGTSCVNDFSYACSPLTGCSAPANTCRCAAGSKCANTNICRLPTAASWLDSAADLVCELQAP